MLCTDVFFEKLLTSEHTTPLQNPIYAIFYCHPPQSGSAGPFEIEMLKRFIKWRLATKTQGPLSGMTNKTTGQIDQVPDGGTQPASFDSVRIFNGVTFIIQTFLSDDSE